MHEMWTARIQQCTINSFVFKTVYTSKTHEFLSKLTDFKQMKKASCILRVACTSTASACIPLISSFMHSFDPHYLLSVFMFSTNVLKCGILESMYIRSNKPCLLRVEVKKNVSKNVHCLTVERRWNGEAGRRKQVNAVYRWCVYFLLHFPVLRG